MQTQTVRLVQMAALMCGGAASLAASAHESDATAKAQGTRASTGENTQQATAILSIVEPRKTDAQCIDATGACSVAVSYAAQIANPGRTETGAGMDIEAAMPVAAARADDDPELDEAGAHAAPRLAQLEPPAQAALPVPAEPRVQAVPLEQAARGEEAEPVTQPAPPVRHVLRPARPALLPDVRRPVRKPPVSYAAPVAVPVRAAAGAAVAATVGAAVSVETKQTEAVSAGMPMHKAGAAAEDGATLAAHPAPGEARTVGLAVVPTQAVHVLYAAGSAKSRDEFAAPPSLPDAGASASSSSSATSSATAQLPAPAVKTARSYAAPIAVAAHAATPSGERAPRAALATHSASGNEDPNWSRPAQLALSDERLDTMRGGFDLSSGLKVSFGISRMVVVNGNLVTTTSFNIPDIANITAQQAQTLASVNAGALLQNGPGNVVQGGALPSLSGAVIQNSLNNQNIQALTTINTTVNSLSMFKSFNIGTTLNSALTSAVRGR
ncbi:MAG TPA: hypothetical protein VNE00_18030 [Paraburkholderia sp.]|jgi:hypothetical protein|nr:hypothetical protein [Paraburkholderia sp.]